MAYGVKYSGSIASADGSTYTVEILKNGFSGSVTPIVLAKPVATVRWGQQGDEIYTPLRPSSAEILVFDKLKVVQQDIFNADEEMFRLRIKKGSSVYWIGKIITDGFEDSLNLAPQSTKITAIDGLGQLEGLSFDDTTRVSIVQCVADLLDKLGLDLNIRFASNWFTPGILASEDPLAQICAERLAERSDQDELLSSKEVLEEYLLRYGLQLHQSGGIWRVTQRELLGDSGFTYYEYDKDGTFVTSDVEIPAVTMTENDQYGKRLKDGRRPYKTAYKTTTVLYVPKPGQENLMINGSFETWTGLGMAGELPDGWVPTNDLDLVSSSGVAADGALSLSVPAQYSSDPDRLPTANISREVDLVSNGLDALQIRISAQAIRNPNYITPISFNPRKAYLKILYGGYYLHRAPSGTLTWVAVGEGEPNDDYILLHNEGCSILSPGWQEDLLETPAVPVASGQLRIELYPLVEFEFTVGQEEATAPCIGILYDNIVVLPVVTSTGLKTISASIVAPNTANKDSVQFRIGDGPTATTVSCLTIGASTLTGNWKRGPYSGGALTGTSIDSLTSKTWLRAQKVPLEIHIATYTARAAAGALIEAHNVLVIGTKRYAFTFLERDLIAGHSSGEWVEIRADDDDMLTATEVITEEGETGVFYGDSTPVGSKTFASGFMGSGWQIEKNPDSGDYILTIDRLRVRKSMSVMETLVQQVRATNGSLFISATGKVKNFTKLST